MVGILMHKNTEVAKIRTSNGKIISVDRVFYRDKLPVGTRSKTGELLIRSLQAWQEMRAIPSDRQGIDTIIQEFRLETPLEIYETTEALCLTDCYWIRRKKEDKDWRNINYHDNPFLSDFASKVLFEKDIQEIYRNSPDFTTDGCLKKAWICLNKVPVLLKAGDLGENSKGKNLLSANEVFASKLANMCGIQHIEYFPVRVNGEYICGSECFVKDSNTDFVNALQFIRERKCGAGIDTYRFFSDIGLREDVDKMILFDHIIRNTDRHEKNFGVLVNADDGSLLSFALLFDNGSCLGWNHTDGAERPEICKPFADTFKEQLDQVKNVNIRIPDFNVAESMLKEIYEEFKIEEQQYNRALIELKCGIRDIENKKRSI